MTADRDHGAGIDGRFRDQPCDSTGKAFAQFLVEFTEHSEVSLVRGLEQAEQLCSKVRRQCMAFRADYRWQLVIERKQGGVYRIETGTRQQTDIKAGTHRWLREWPRSRPASA